MGWGWHEGIPEWPLEIRENVHAHEDDVGNFIKCLLCEKTRGYTIRIRMSRPYDQRHWTRHEKSNSHKKGLQILNMAEKTVMNMKKERQLHNDTIKKKKMAISEVQVLKKPSRYGWPSEIVKDETVIVDTDGLSIHCIVCTKDCDEKVMIKTRSPFHMQYYRQHVKSQKHLVARMRHSFLSNKNENGNINGVCCTKNEDKERVSTPPSRMPDKSTSALSTTGSLAASAAVVVEWKNPTTSNRLNRIGPNTPWKIILELLPQIPEEKLFEFIKRSCSPDTMRQVELHFNQSECIMEITRKLWEEIHPKGGRTGYWAHQVSKLRGHYAPNKHDKIIEYAHDLVTEIEIQDKIPPLTIMKRLPHLHTVRIVGPLVMKEWISVGDLLTECTDITTLALHRTNITAENTEVLRILFRISRKWTFKLYDCSMSIPASFMIAHFLYALVSLHISSTVIPCLGLWIKAIWQAPNIHTVTLCNVGVTVDHWTQVHHETPTHYDPFFEHSLTFLNVSGNGTMQGVGIQALLTALEAGNMKSLKHLNVSDTAMGKEGAFALEEAIHRQFLNHLEVLEMAKNDIPASRLLTMLQMMVTQTKVHSLDVSFNNIEGNDNIVPSILTLLAPTLRRLKWKGNQFHLTSNVLNVFTNCPHLLYLDLSMNLVKGDDVVALVHCLSQGSPHLKVLNLEKTGINNVVLASIQRMFQKETALSCWPKTVLNIMDNALKFPQALSLLTPWAPSTVFCSKEHVDMKSRQDWVSYT